MTIKHKTREAWLEACAAEITKKYGDVFGTHFGSDGSEHLAHLKLSTGFPSRGGLTKVIGECWKSIAAEDEKSHHIFINPRLTDIVTVVATVAHEMVHAADDGESKHKGKFLKAVRDMGLEGKATATVAGAGFAEWARGLETKLGEYPHTGLVPVLEIKKQGTRMLKVECPECEYQVRTTRKWLDVGVPTCPCGSEMVEEVKDDE